MTRAAIDRTNTIQLVWNMIRLRKDLEPLLEKGKSFHLWRLRENREQRLDRLGEAWETHCQALGKRYKWLINQIHERIEAGASDAARDQYLRAWWRIVENDLPGLADAREFSPRLWTALAAAAGQLEDDGAFESAAALKPKFMLRQFVDEMRDVESSVALKALAYSPLTANTEFLTADTTELSEIAYEACLSLHETVIRFKTLLPAMTGGAIDVGTPADTMTIARRYSHWLFRS